MGDIYLGRIVAIGCSPTGKPTAMYRVSSRSFPNRRAQISEDGKRVSIVPKKGHEGDVFKNPYIAYNCAMVLANQIAVVSNGSHTDPIAEKLAAGMPIRDALVYGLAALDYEHDAYNTPRIAAVVSSAMPTGEGGGALTGWLGVVRKDGLDVRSFPLQPGRCLHLSTYEHAVPLPERSSDFKVESAMAACEHVLGAGAFADFTNPVTAVCLFADEAGFQIALQDA